MSKKLHGFSLAELLVSLLIISIVLSAAIPTITRKAGADREQIWRWSTDKSNNAYFGVGSNQSAILGANSIPSVDNPLKDIYTENADDTIHKSSFDEISSADTKLPDDIKFGTEGDKLVILKKSYSSFMNSHISFYTMPNKEGATTSSINYAGRIAMDPSSIAIGMGTLLKQSENNNGENTAIGHFSQLKNTTGYKNTALGKKSLTFNELGSYNTAIGFGSLFKLGNDHETKNNLNTSVGSIAMHSMLKGNRNTSIGAEALRYNEEGNNNTVIGESALFNLKKGSGNTIIGTEACKHLVGGSNNICIGYLAGNSAVDDKDTSTTKSSIKEDTNGLYIGAGEEAPLISGHTEKVEKDGKIYDKELIINAKKVEFRPFNSSGASFVFHSYSGTDGYETGTKVGRWGVAAFNLRDTGGGDKSSVSMTFGAVGTNATDKEVRIQTYDKYNTSDPDRMADISFNNILRLDFPPFLEKQGTTTTKTYSKVGIIAQSVPETSSGTIYKYALNLNNKLEIENNDNAPNVYITSSDGFSVKTGTAATDSYFNLKKDSGTMFINGGSNGSIYFNPEFGAVWDTKGNNKLATKGIFAIDAAQDNDGTNKSYIKLGNSFFLDETSLIHKKLTVKSGNIIDAIKDHEERIKTLETASTPSDERLKNISGDNVAGLKEINQIEVKNYTYKNDEKKTPHVGVIAQQLQKIFPNSVIKGEDGFLRIKTEEIFYAMLNSIKELYTQVQNITAKITGLDKRINELEKQNKMLIEQNKAFEKRLQKLEQKSK